MLLIAFEFKAHMQRWAYYLRSSQVVSVFFSMKDTEADLGLPEHPRWSALW